MKHHDPEVRRHLLRPLVRRRILPAHSSRIETAFRELEERAIASALLPEMVAAQKQVRLDKQKDRWKDPEAAKSRIQFGAAMYLARRISFQEYIFLVAHASEGVHDGRINDGAYPELKSLSSSMRQVELAHGLTPGQYWLIKDAPPEYRRLSTKWNAAAHRRLSETVTELEGQAAAALFQSDTIKFKRLRERGRRSFFHKDELVPALADTIKRYEREARASAEAGAFTAAVTLLGASMEGLLLLRCLRSRAKASRIAKELPKKQRPRDPSSPARWSFDNLIQICLRAGWLPVVHTSAVSFRPDGLAHLLRQMRNYIHPGKVCADRPWIEAERRDFEDAEVIYTTLFSTVFRGAMLKQYVSEPSADEDNP